MGTADILLFHIFRVLVHINMHFQMTLIISGANFNAFFNASSENFLEVLHFNLHLNVFTKSNAKDVKFTI